MSPISALNRLKAGNDAFISGDTRDNSISCLQKRRQLATEGQNPFAVVVTCADSRVPAEAIFQTELGDLFVIRVAGCCVDSSVIASVEYAVSHFQCQVCVVMGHSQCGAVHAALDAVESGTDLPSESLNRMLAPIMEVITTEIELKKDMSKSQKFDHATKVATIHQIKRLKAESKIIARKEQEGQLVLIPARYDIHSGSVAFDLGGH